MVVSQFVFGIKILAILSNCHEIFAGLDITVHPDSQAVLEDEDVVFNCVAKYTPDPPDIIQPGSEGPEFHYLWEFNSQDVKLSLPQASMFTNHSLFVPRIQEWGYGSYQCIVIAELEDQNLTTTSGIATLVHTYIKDFFIHPASQTISKWEMAVLECVTGRSAPVPIVHWEKDSEIFSDGIQTNVVFGSEGAGKSGQLTMHLELNVTHEFGGVYRCVARSDRTQQVVKSETAVLNVTAPLQKPYFIKQPPLYLTFFSSTPAWLSCQIGGFPEPTYSWYRNSRLLSGSRRLKTLPNGTLHITNVVKEDALLYRCSGRNTKGTILSDPINVTVTYIDLEFLDEPVDTVAMAGTSAKLNCTPPISVPTASVVWYKDGRYLLERNGEFSVKIESDWTLHLSNVQMFDEGDYTCIAYNELAMPNSRKSETVALSVLAAPTIVEPPIDVKLSKGELLKLVCKLEGSPFPDIKWYHDGAVINDNGIRVDIRLSGQELYISSINKGDEGLYHCGAINTHGMVNSPVVFVDVIVPPYVVVTMTDVTVTEGDETYFTCTIFGDPKPVITWYQDITEIDLSQPNLLKDDNGLHIQSVTRFHDGNYTCYAENEGGFIEIKASLHVQVGPEVFIPPSNVTVNTSMKAVFYCDMSGVPQPQIKWLFEGKELTSEKAEILNDNKSLVISRTDRSHTGWYVCEGENNVGKVSSSAYLFVQVPPVIYNLTVNKVSLGKSFIIDQGQTLKFYCDVGGDPLPKVSWYFNGLQLFSTPEGRITLPTDEEVKIEFVSSVDEGMYECRAKNNAGKNSKSIQIFVREIPLAPYLADATPHSKTSIELFWTAPNMKSYDYITGYILQYKLKAALVYILYDDKDTNENSTSIIVDGLRASTEYVFRIAAVNNIGQGQYSNTLGASTLETAPSSPRSLSVVSYNPVTISLQWVVPNITNGELKMYQLWYKEKYVNSEYFQKIDISPVDLPLQIYTLENLQPYTTYMFRVRGATIQDTVVMWGDFTDDLNFTTPAAAPSASPGVVSLSAVSSRSVNVTWQVLDSDEENGPLQGYILQYSEVQSESVTELTVQPSILSVVIEQLRPYTEYSVVVMAYNGEGRGPASSKQQTVTTLPEAPSGAPQKVSTTAISSSEIAVEWQLVPKEGRNSDISGYIVEVSSDTTVDVFSQYVGSPDTLELKISELLPWTKYSVKIQAFTTQVTDGFGPFTAPVLVTTLPDVPQTTVSELKIETLPNAIRISWSAPDEPNGNIVGYTLIYKILNVPIRKKREIPPPITLEDFEGFTSVYLHASNPEYKISPVEAGSEYFIGVAAHTLAGRGPFANQSLIADKFPTTTEADELSTFKSRTITIPLDKTSFAMDTTLTSGTITSGPQAGLSDSQEIGIIIGAVLVALVVIILVIVIVIMCVRWRKRKQPAPNGLRRPSVEHQIRSHHQYPTADYTEKSAHYQPTTSHAAKDQVNTYNNHHQRHLQELPVNQKRHSNSPDMVTSRGHVPSIIVSSSDRDLSVPSSVTGPLRYENQEVRHKSSRLKPADLGIDNPGFYEDGHTGEDDVGELEPNTPQRRDYLSGQRNRMDSTLAAIIAAEKDRNTSVFNVLDTEILLDTDSNSVIVYDERTAL